MNNKSSRIMSVLTVSLCFSILASAIIYFSALTGPALAQTKAKKFPDDYVEDTAPTSDDWMTFHDVTSNSLKKVHPTNSTKAFGLTAGCVPYATTGGQLTDSSTLLHDGTYTKVNRLVLGSQYPPVSSTVYISMVTENNVSPISITSDGSHNTSPGASFFQFLNTASDLTGGNISFFRGGGSISGADFTNALAAIDGNYLGHIHFRSYTVNGASTTGRSAQISAICDGGASSGSSPGKLVLRTSPSGTTQPVTRQTIRADGSVMFNETGVTTGDVQIQGDTDANLFFSDASTDRVGIGKNNPATKLDVSGTTTSTAFSGGSVSVTGPIDGDTVNTGWGAVELRSSAFTPTPADNTNVDTGIFAEGVCMQVGTTVTVSGEVVVDTTAAGATTLEFNIPFASAFAATADLAGTAFSGEVAGLGAQIQAQVANDRAIMTWVAPDGDSHTYSFHFTYQIR